MGMFPHTITVLNKVLKGDDVVYLPSILSGTLFVRLSASTKSTTGLDPSNVVKVTIPMSVKAQKPFISSYNMPNFPKRRNEVSLLLRKMI